MKLCNETVVVYARRSEWPSAHWRIYLRKQLIGENLDEEEVGVERGGRGIITGLRKCQKLH